MSLADLATRSQVASVDNKLARLAADLRKQRGEPGAELATLNKIDELLDRRLHLSEQSSE